MKLVYTEDSRRDTELITRKVREGKYKSDEKKLAAEKKIKNDFATLSATLKYISETYIMPSQIFSQSGGALFEGDHFDVKFLIELSGINSRHKVYEVKPVKEEPASKAKKIGKKKERKPTTNIRAFVVFKKVGSEFEMRVFAIVGKSSDGKEYNPTEAMKRRIKEALE